MSKRYKYEPTMAETILRAIFKALWFLISLPFKKGATKKGISLADRNDILVQRSKIESLLNSENEYELKHALMEADKLVDHVLKLKGYAGETFADRLRSAEQYIDSNVYQALWEGHKVRNTLAHEHDAKISKEELREATKKLLKYNK